MKLCTGSNATSIWKNRDWSSEDESMIPQTLKPPNTPAYGYLVTLGLGAGERNQEA
jgi:hypothetical protein